MARNIVITFFIICCIGSTQIYAKPFERDNADEVLNVKNATDQTKSLNNRAKRQITVCMHVFSQNNQTILNCTQPQTPYSYTQTDGQTNTKKKSNKKQKPEPNRNKEPCQLVTDEKTGLLHFVPENCANNAERFEIPFGMGNIPPLQPQYPYNAGVMPFMLPPQQPIGYNMMPYSPYGMQPPLPPSGMPCPHNYNCSCTKTEDGDVYDDKGIGLNDNKDNDEDEEVRVDDDENDDAANERAPKENNDDDDDKDKPNDEDDDKDDVSRTTTDENQPGRMRAANDEDNEADKDDDKSMSVKSASDSDEDDKGKLDEKELEKVTNLIAMVKDSEKIAKDKLAKKKLRTSRYAARTEEDKETKATSAT